MGLVQSANGLIAIDTGLDKQSAKAIIRAAQVIGRPLVAILNTHAHADHYGGNAALLKTHSVPVYAPSGEAQIMRRPQLEPEYLWHGAQPLPGLVNKFLLAEQSPVHVEFSAGDVLNIDGIRLEPVALPGHAQNQVGVRVHDVLFAADAYFDEPVVDKHGIPFMVDYVETLSSARHVLSLEATWIVPGHGNPLQGEPPQAAVDYLIRRHETVFAQVVGRVETAPATFEDLVADACQKLQLSPSTVTAYALLATPIAAYITAAVQGGLIEVCVRDGQCLFVAAAK